MEIKSVAKEYPVVDYDFAFIGGGRLPVTIAESKGDSVQDNGTHFTFTIAERANILDPDKSTPGETIRVFKQHVTAYIERHRTQQEFTEEQIFNLRKLLHTPPDTVQ